MNFFFLLLWNLISVTSSFSLFPSSTSGEEDAASTSSSRSIFEFTVKNQAGEMVPLLNYSNGKKAFLIVNVASQCGLTERNYNELNILYEKYASRGLEIIGFPCNNFLYQEPGTDHEISQFCSKKGVKFPIMAKIDCGNTPSAEPLFPFLCRKLPDQGLLSSLVGTGPKWNFTKFLCDKNGIPIKRYQPNVNPLEIEDDILSLLEDSNSSPSAVAGETTKQGDSSSSLDL
jgi:glutathione peroxidase